MDLKTSATALFVKDIEISKEFYVGLLGMSVDLDFGKNVIFKNGFAIWEISRDHVIPKTLGYDNVSDSDINRFELYFETEELDEIFEALKVNKVRFLHEIHNELWGQRTIRFFDPDNHLIEVGESMRQFVQKFYDQGLSFEQVSQKTSVPVEEVIRLINQ